MASPYADALPDLAGVAGARCVKQIALIVHQFVSKTGLVSTRVCRLLVNRVFGRYFVPKPAQITRELQFSAQIGVSKSA